MGPDRGVRGCLATALVARSLEIFQGHFVFQEIRWTTFMSVRRRGKTGFWPPGNCD